MDLSVTLLVAASAFGPGPAARSSIVFLDGGAGDDSNPGSEQYPFKSLEACVFCFTFFISCDQTRSCCVYIVTDESMPDLAWDAGV